MADTQGARRIFVTGTDTDVGKTVVSAALVLGLDGYYWKPVQAGTEPTTDSAQVRAWTGLPPDRVIPETYVLREPMSPHAAAALEGVELDVGRILQTPLPADRPLVIEGAGGLLVPLTRTKFVADLIEGLDAQVVLVARTGLGTINHTLLSLAELARRSIPVLGVVMNGPPHESNRRAIESYGRTRVLGVVPPCDVIDETIVRMIFTQIDLYDATRPA
jgi:dethiobiotin synthase